MLTFPITGHMQTLILFFMCFSLALKSKEIISHKFIDLGNGHDLFYVCLKKEFFQDPTESFWNYSLSNVVDTGDIFESDKSPNTATFYLATLPCTALAQPDELTEIEEGLFNNNYTNYNFNILSSDSENDSLRKDISIPEDLKSLENKPVLGEKKRLLPVKAALDDQAALENSSSISLIEYGIYFIVFLTLIILVCILHNLHNLAFDAVGKDKFLIAIRKKWLERARKSGSISEVTYLELLSTITNKIWISENNESMKDYSEIDFESSDTVGDLNKGQNGEYAFRIREMSERKTCQ